MRMGSLEGREVFGLCATRELRLARVSAGGCGWIQGEQNKHWSSGKAVVRKLAGFGVCRTRSPIASAPAEFMGAYGSTWSNSR
jgi:hypothetical protein